MKIFFLISMIALPVFGEGMPYDMANVDSEVISAKAAAKLGEGRHPLYVQIKYAAKQGEHKITSYQGCDANNTKSLADQGYKLKENTCPQVAKTNQYCQTTCEISW